MTTRAVQVRAFGGPGVLVSAALPDPEPGPGEVVIDVAAADVLFAEERWSPVPEDRIPNG